MLFKNFLPRIIILLFYCQNPCSAQITQSEQKQLDSLILILNSTVMHDTSIASANVKMSEILYVYNLDTLKYFCEIAKSITTKGLEKSNNLKVSKSFKKSLSLALNNLGYYYENQSQFDKSLTYYFESLKITEELKDDLEKATCLNNIGNVYYYQGETDKALEYFFKSLYIKEGSSDKIGYARALSNIGSVYANQGQIEKCLEYHHKALKVNKEVNYNIGIALNLNNIGLVYLNNDYSDKGVKYFQEALILNEVAENKLGTALVLNNLGMAFAKDNNLDKSLDYYFMALAINEEVGNMHGWAMNLNNIGHAYSVKEDHEKSQEYYQKSLEINQKIGSKSSIALSFHNLGSTLLKSNQMLKAKEFLNQAFVLEQDLGDPRLIMKTAGLLSEIASRQNKFKEAYEMYQLHVKMRDSINNEETYKASIQKEAKYEYEKQATADSIVNAEAEKVHLANLEAEKAKGEQQKTEIAAQKKQNIYLFIGLGLVALFGFFMFNRFKVTQKQKGIIEDQKLEVETQKVTVEKTLQELEFTHEQLEESHKEITDSINYAERIQRSFLATKETLNENLKDYFVFFKPKEAVSGDFYWAAQLNNNNFAFTVADSTGHGVPGAIMSLLNITSLEKSIETETDPHNILNKTREIIINRLKKDGSEHGGKDGMDCNLMVLNQDKSVLSFASANNTIVIIRDGEILEYKGDKMPVGKHDKDTESFTLHSVQLQKGDVIYALTDGFPDQFGGPKGKKYMIKNLKNKFLQIADMPMIKQEEFLSEEFSNWMQDNEQIDDVCIIGVRV